MTTPFLDPSRIDPRYEARAITFENPTGERGAGGTVAGARKGAPSRKLGPGERVRLAAIEGPGTIRHLWMTFTPAPPEVMRSLVLEVRYGGRDEPSVWAPCTDFFGVPHGRPVAFDSALLSIHEGRGFNSYLPIPFDDSVEIDVVNHADRRTDLYFQIDYTLAPEIGADAGRLHVAWRRENPTTVGRDFTIVEGLQGPGRFLGCNVGVRVIGEGNWYGEGEVKIYTDGDRESPTICGTGLEDYVGTAWGMGPHHALYAGAPLDVRRTVVVDGLSQPARQPDLIGFYRWHLPDPVMFEQDLRVTIQQIGAVTFGSGDEDAYRRFKDTHDAAGQGWIDDPVPGVIGFGLHERVDDYCATSYLYLRDVQAVPQADPAEVTADIERRDYEWPSRTESLLTRAGLAGA